MTVIFIPFHGKSISRQEGPIAESTILIEYLLSLVYGLMVVEPL